MNECTRLEMEKWEINKTHYPQLVGSSFELFRKWNYEMDGGLFPEGLKTQRKICKTMMETYEKKLPAYVGGYEKYRALIWSCPAHFYANLSNWLANCWGIYALTEMEALNMTKMLNTTDKEEAINDLCRLYERMVMRATPTAATITFWASCGDSARTSMRTLLSCISTFCCKTMAGLQGLFDDQARELGIPWTGGGAPPRADRRAWSRKGMRGRVNNYMVNVMHAEPVDPTLIDIDDEVTW